MDEVIASLRAVCLDFPQAEEKDAWGQPTFRVRNRVFVTAGLIESPGGEPARLMTFKAEEGEQEALLAEGHPFFYPRATGSTGWVGCVLVCDTDWTEIREFVEDSYRQVAPVSLIAELKE